MYLIKFIYSLLTLDLHPMSLGWGKNVGLADFAIF